MPTPDDLRLAVADLSTLAVNDLRSIWRTSRTAEATRDALEELLPPVVSVYGSASASVAADWYDEVRAEVDTERRFRAITADLGDLGTNELARHAVGPLFDAVPDVQRARVLAEGGMQLRIANAARNTITGSAIADPDSRGWQRSASGGCPFCQMLAGRGAVYTRSTVTFAAHDNCNCVAVPVFGDRPPIQPYTPTDRRITDADRARVRKYLATHHAG